jgi:hypothetical protein
LVAAWVELRQEFRSKILRRNLKSYAFVQQSGSTSHRFEVRDFTRFAFGVDFNRAAADFAIRREPLAGDACVHHHFKRLAAEGALEVCKFFHVGNLTAPGQSAIWPAKFRLTAGVAIWSAQQFSIRSAYLARDAAEQGAFRKTSATAARWNRSRLGQI